MSKPEKLFVIINPTLDKHVALERAIQIANSVSVRPQIVVFVSVDATRVEDKPSNKKLHRDSDWLEREICNPLKLNNIKLLPYYDKKYMPAINLFADIYFIVMNKKVEKVYIRNINNKILSISASMLLSLIHI